MVASLTLGIIILHDRESRGLDVFCIKRGEDKLNWGSEMSLRWGRLRRLGGLAHARRLFSLDREPRTTEERGQRG